jgi:hypothetical protein
MINATSPKPTILVLVLSVDHEPWCGIELQGQRATWADPEAIPDGCEVVYYYGVGGLYRFVGRVVGRLARVRGSNLLSRGVHRVGKSLIERMARHSATKSATLDGDRLFTRVPEVYKFALPKMISALRWATAPGMPRFDFVYRTNTSSYISLPRLQEVAASMPRTNCYAGFRGLHKTRGYHFVSGSGMLLSWDIACRVGDTLTGWNWEMIDDEALGELLDKADVAVRPLPRTSVQDVDEVEMLPAEELRTAFHFRCKSSSEPRADAAIMRAIHARIRGDRDTDRFPSTL